MTQHDGSVLRLRKLAEDYDPTDRVAAHELPAGAPGARARSSPACSTSTRGHGDLHEHLDTVDTPLNRLGDAELCPGAAALDEINARLALIGAVTAACPAAGADSPPMASTFIVTGGAGFIGSNLVKALNARGRDDIIVVDDLTDGRKFANLAGARIADYLDRAISARRARQAKDFGQVAAVFHQGACTDTTEWNGR